MAAHTGVVTVPVEVEITGPAWDRMVDTLNNLTARVEALEAERDQASK